MEDLKGKVEDFLLLVCDYTLLKGKEPHGQSNVKYMYHLYNPYT